MSFPRPHGESRIQLEPGGVPWVLGEGRTLAFPMVPKWKDLNVQGACPWYPFCSGVVRLPSYLWIFWGRSPGPCVGNRRFKNGLSLAFVATDQGWVTVLVWCFLLWHVCFWGQLCAQVDVIIGDVEGVHRETENRVLPLKHLHLSWWEWLNACLYPQISSFRGW